MTSDANTQSDMLLDTRNSDIKDIVRTVLNTVLSRQGKEAWVNHISIVDNDLKRASIIADFEGHDPPAPVKLTITLETAVAQ